MLYDRIEIGCGNVSTHVESPDPKSLRQKKSNRKRLVGSRGAQRKHTSMSSTSITSAINAYLEDISTKIHSIQQGMKDVDTLLQLQEDNRTEVQRLCDGILWTRHMQAIGCPADPLPEVIAQKV